MIAIVSLACFLLGCETCPHYNRVKVIGPNGLPVVAQPKKPYGTVKLYQDKSEVTEKYEVFALMSLEGNPGEETRFITAFLYVAADLGADGVILYRGQQHGVRGPYWSTSMVGAYRAEAILHVK